MRRRRHRRRPAGSTAAALLARRGYRVIALEKAAPSALPHRRIAAAHEPAGLRASRRAATRCRRSGCSSAAPISRPTTSTATTLFAFGRALGDSPPHAYQVWRQDFDQMLFEHARDCGAEAREGHEVAEFRAARQPRQRGCRCAPMPGRATSLQARYVIDASGRDTFLASKREAAAQEPRAPERRDLRAFQRRRAAPGADAGNISMYRFAHGWMWMIPLPQGVMSVGAVCWPEYLKQRKGRTAEFLMETLQQNPALWAAPQDAQLISDEVRVTGNYSYDCAAHGRARLDPGRRCICVPRSGVLHRRVSRDERGRSGRGAGGRRAARAGARAGAAAPAGAAPARRHAALLVLHLPLQRAGDRATCSASPRNILQLEQGIISMLAGDLFDAPRGAVAPESCSS